MASIERPASVKGLVVASLLSILFGLIHVSDAIVRVELGDPVLENIDATANSVYAVTYLMGVALSWNRRRAGYLIVLLLSALSSYGFFGHATGISPPNLTEVGRISGVFFVFAVLMGAVSSVSTVLLSIYALAKERG